ncbi:MAG: M55 family metallopeptidase [Clostridia bacterium]|jgi:D-amino peptidase|nr:M55 family metallopeptidase [Clostridiaceae bacterium]
MNIIMVTDMEGVAGIVDFPNWCTPGGMYYDKGKRLLTEEVNAAVRGFMDAGAQNIYVLDGHGPGGIDIEVLDPRAYYIRGSVYYSLQFMQKDWKIDVFCHVGQHAKSRTEYSHLAHTQGTSYFEETVNGVPIGEFGEFAFYCAKLGIPPIFGSGEEAFCKEALELAPHMETVAVKKGLTPGRGDECTASEYAARNVTALHVQPQKAREMIYEGAKKAATRYLEDPTQFTLPFSDLKPPFVKTVKYRKDQQREDLIKVANSVEEIYTKRFIY